MNETWAKLASCDEDVTNIMKWWLVKKSHKKYLRMAMRVGGVREVVQETCLAIIKVRHKDISCHWTTAAINQTRWTLLLMFKRYMTKADADAVFLREVSHELTSPDRQIALAVQNELVERMKLCLKTLSYRERSIVELRYNDSMTYDEVGHVFKVTRERVRQIEAKAIRKLMQPDVSRNVVMFLDT